MLWENSKSDPAQKAASKKFELQEDAHAVVALLVGRDFMLPRSWVDAEENCRGARCECSRRFGGAFEASRGGREGEAQCLMYLTGEGRMEEGKSTSAKKLKCHPRYRILEYSDIGEIRAVAPHLASHSHDSC